MNEMLQNLKCNTTILQISIQCRIDNGMILTGEEVSANKTHRLKKKKKKKKKKIQETTCLIAGCLAIILYSS